MEVRGTREQGRPRMKWMNNIRHDMNKCGVEEGDVQHRRTMVHNPDLAGRGRKRRINTFRADFVRIKFLRKITFLRHLISFM